MILTLYIIISYLVVLGMIIQNYDSTKNITHMWIGLLFSPIILPILLGMTINDRE